MAARANIIYWQLVMDDNDMLGMVAYALYKRQKFEFIENFRQKHGEEPAAADFSAFNDLISSELQLKSYLNEAWALTEYFSDSLLEKHKAELEMNAYKTLKAKSSFWFGVWQGVVASFVFVI